MNRILRAFLISFAGLTIAAPVATAQQPAPSWPAGDERGMANAVGPETWGRCAAALSQANAKSYELSHPRSSTMPLSPFAGPYAPKYAPTGSLPGSSQVFNMDSVNDGAMPSQQGTQMDALGHFGYLPAPWDGTSPLAVDSARYYGGFTQKDVKPTPESPLLRLGMEKAPPIVTTAVLLDAKRHVGKGQAMKAGELVTSKHISEMIEAQGLQKRGILPGDVVYVHTGWGDRWADPDTAKVYYSMAPGLSYDAVKYLGDKRVAVVSLDTPFIDAMAEGQLAGKAGTPPGTPPELAFVSHHHLLSQMGIHLVENAKLDDLARDQVWTSCTMILPLREKGSAGSPVRPVAIGAPAR
jgi:kynurenine formamidase